MSINLVPHNVARWHLSGRHFVSRDRHVRRQVPRDFGTCHVVSGNFTFPFWLAMILLSTGIHDPTGRRPTISRTSTDC
jgi:hypothetical protein